MLKRILEAYLIIMLMPFISLTGWAFVNPEGYGEFCSKMSYGITDMLFDNKEV